MAMQADIIFVSVANVAQKLRTIAQLVERHFLLRERVLLSVSSSAAAAYLDELLWRELEASMLPHAIINTFQPENIAIVVAVENLNGSKILFNLREDLHPHFEQFSTVYELFDASSAAKLALSQKKQAAYSHRGFAWRSESFVE